MTLLNACVVCLETKKMIMKRRIISLQEPEYPFVNFYNLYNSSLHSFANFSIYLQLIRKICDQARSTMKGSREHRFVMFEIQVIREAWHSEISPILLAMKLFPLQVKHIKIAPLLKIYFAHLNRPVAKGGSLGAKEPPSQIKAPQFYQKGSLFCWKKLQICQNCLLFCLRRPQNCWKVHYFVQKVHNFTKKVQYNFVEKVHNFVQKKHPAKVSGYGPVELYA